MYQWAENYIGCEVNSICLRLKIVGKIETADEAASEETECSRWLRIRDRLFWLRYFMIIGRIIYVSWSVVLFWQMILLRRNMKHATGTRVGQYLLQSGCCLHEFPSDESGARQVNYYVSIYGTTPSHIGDSILEN